MLPFALPMSSQRCRQVDPSARDRRIDPSRRGTITVCPPQATIGYLRQEPDQLPNETVLAFLTRRTGVTDAALTLETATTALAIAVVGSDDAYSEALDRLLDLLLGHLPPSQ